MKQAIALIALIIIAVIAIIATFSGIAFAEDNLGHLLLVDADNKAIPAIFRPSEARASNDLMVLEDRCIEIFDLDGDHLHWAPYDLVSGAIAYYPSPCMPEPPEFYFNSLCTQGLVDPGDTVAFFHVEHQTLSRSSVSVSYTLTSAYSMKAGVCAPVTFPTPRVLVSIRPMGDTSPWPSSLPGKKPFHIEVSYD